MFYHHKLHLSTDITFVIKIYVDLGIEVRNREAILAPWI